MSVPCFNDDVNGEDWDQVKKFFTLKCEILNFVPWVKIPVKILTTTETTEVILKNVLGGGGWASFTLPLHPFRTGSKL